MYGLLFLFPDEGLDGLLEGEDILAGTFLNPLRQGLNDEEDHENNGQKGKEDKGKENLVLESLSVNEEIAAKSGDSTHR